MTWYYSSKRSKSKVPLDEAMEIGEAFKRFDRVLTQFQRRGYGNRDILLDAMGTTTQLRMGTALAAMMRNVKIVHQRVRRDRHTGRAGTSTHPGT
jgi:hypothetical protein